MSCGSTWRYPSINFAALNRHHHPPILPSPSTPLQASIHPPPAIMNSAGNPMPNPEPAHINSTPGQIFEFYAVCFALPPARLVASSRTTPLLVTLLSARQRRSSANNFMLHCQNLTKSHENPKHITVYPLLRFGQNKVASRSNPIDLVKQSGALHCPL